MPPSTGSRSVPRLRAGQAVILTCHDVGFVDEVSAYAEVESVVLDGEGHNPY